MGDSDDDYESAMNKRRGQSRNKFRKERDDSHNGDSMNDIADSGRRKDKRDPDQHYYNSNNNHNSGNNPRRGYYDDNHKSGGFKNERSNSMSNHRGGGYGPGGFGMGRNISPQSSRSHHGPPPNRHGGYFNPDLDYHNDDMGMMGAGYKRPSSSLIDSSPASSVSSHYYNSGMNKNPGMTGMGYGGHQHSMPGHNNMLYENQSKKPRRDWSALEGANQSGGYYEHDNRLGPDYDDYGDEYNDDYNRLNRPSNYSSYKYDRYDNNGNNDMYGGPNGAPSMGPGYPPYNKNYPMGSGNQGPMSGNVVSNINNAAQALINTVAPMLSQVAPMGDPMGPDPFNSSLPLNSTYKNNLPYNNNSYLANNSGSGAYQSKFMNNSANNGNNSAGFGLNNKPGLIDERIFTNNPQNSLSALPSGFDNQTQPQMMSFKQFLNTLSNDKEYTNGGPNGGISPELATKKYNDYKNNFRREQIAQFFNAHKHEEWFKCRYHPEESTKRKEEQRVSIKRRKAIFISLLEKYNKEDLLTLDMSDDINRKRLYKFLDACMILLEEGTEKDLDILESIYDFSASEVVVEKTENKSNDKNDLDNKSDLGESNHPILEDVDEEEDEEDEDDDEDMESKTTSDSTSKFDRLKKEKKRKSTSIEANTVKSEDDTDKPTADVSTAKEDSDVKKEDPDEDKNEQKAPVSSAVAAAMAAAAAIKSRISNKDDGSEKKTSQTLPQKTQSIFFKHLPVIVTRQDLEKIGKRFAGFKRASISEPAPERRFQRRGWITFDSTVNIKEVCSKINGTRLYDMMLNAAINRELDQKVKCISGLSNHQSIARNDLSLICRVVNNMDKRWGLWQYSDNYDQNKKIANSTSDSTNSKTNETSNTTNGDHKEQTNEKKQTKTNELKSEVKEVEPIQLNELFNDPVSEAIRNKTFEVDIQNVNPLILSALKYLKELKETTNENDDKNKSVNGTESVKNGTTEDVEMPSTENIEEVKSEEKEIVKSEETMIKEDVKTEVGENSEDKNNETKQEKDQIEVKLEDTDELKSLDEKKEESSKPSANADNDSKPSANSTSANSSKPSNTIVLYKTVTLEKDEKAAKLLDKLILYLRIVHSIDYYNSTEYQQEDWMPNRCGILHVRGSSAVKNNSSIVNVINGVNINYFDPNSIKKIQIDEWIRLFEIHIKPYVEYRERIDHEMAQRLGLKDIKSEIDKFISSNCQKIDKDIWLCPLSGKKFKGPDYVRKHIETKHPDKLNELRKEVDYFNRFVLDPKRPYLPEHPLTKNIGNQQGNNLPNSMNNNSNMYFNTPISNNYGPGLIQPSYSDRMPLSNYPAPFQNNFNNYQQPYHQPDLANSFMNNSNYNQANIGGSSGGYHMQSNLNYSNRNYNSQSVHHQYSNSSHHKMSRRY